MRRYTAGSSLACGTIIFLLNSGLASAAETLSIPQIQGQASTSSFAGKIVKTTGVVTAIRKVDRDTVVYVQDPKGDNDPETSDGIAVYAFPRDIKAGDVVTVEGRVTENAESPSSLPVTSISPAILKKSEQGVLPTPVKIGAGGLTPPTEAIFDIDPKKSGIAFFQRLEGMLVQIDEAIVVGPTNKFGELWVVANAGRDATGMNALGGITLTPGDANPERIQVQLEKPDVDPDKYQVKVGDRIRSITGVVTYSRGSFEIAATTAEEVTRTDLPKASPLETGARFITVGSYNVENLDPKVEDPNLVFKKNDVDDDVGSGRFRKIAEHIVQSMGAPDVLALQEIQDNDGAEVTDVVSADETLKTLAKAVKDAGGPDYKWIDRPPVDDEEGGLPGGNIRAAFLFNETKVVPVEGDIARIEDPAFAATRLPLVVPFRFGDRLVTVVNVHLSSKTGGDPLYGTVQPPKDSSLPDRTRQARAIRTFLRTRAEPRHPVIIVGDFNTYWYEEPLQILTGGIPAFENLTLRDPALERFSYVFQGNSQALDHALISVDASSKAEFRTFHLNSVLPESEQMSDHDPKLIRLQMVD